MELTYKVRGADGKEYGPATREQVLTWLREGRIHAQSELNRSDVSHWSAARDFDEFQEALPKVARSTPTVATGTSTAMADAATLAQLKSGASWFYWLAGLSLINTIISISGGGMAFIFGLGITQVFDAMAHKVGGAATGAFLVLDFVVAGVAILFGVFANKGHLWAFIVGMALYAADLIIVLVFQDWLAAAVHGYVLYSLFRGFSACRELKSA